MLPSPKSEDPGVARTNQSVVRNRRNTAARLPVRPARRDLRCSPVAPSAASRTTPVNMSAAHGGALARPNPIVPVPSMSTAITVPHALKRPLLNWVAPTNTDANAGNRYGVPADGEPALNDDARQIPARPAMVADTRSEQNRRRSTRML